MMPVHRRGNLLCIDDSCFKISRVGQTPAKAAYFKFSEFEACLRMPLRSQAVSVLFWNLNAENPTFRGPVQYGVFRFNLKSDLFILHNMQHFR